MQQTDYVMKKNVSSSNESTVANSIFWTNKRYFFTHLSVSFFKTLPSILYRVLMRRVQKFELTRNSHEKAQRKQAGRKKLSDQRPSFFFRSPPSASFPIPRETVLPTSFCSPGNANIRDKTKINYLRKVKLFFCCSTHQDFNSVG